MENMMKINELGVLPASEFYAQMPNEFSKKNLFTVYFGGRYDCNADYVIDRDFHDYYLLLRNIQGQLRLEFNGHTYTANPNDLMLIDCRIPHKYFATMNVSFEYIHFKGNVSKEFYEMIIARYSPVISIQNNIEIIASIDVILKMLEQNEFNDFKASYEMHKILSLLIVENHHAASSSDESLRKAIAFINENYWRPLNIEDLANLALLSVYHFSRKFKLLTGLSPHGYLILQRLKHAKSFLKNTDYSIGQISEMIGFNTPSHFISTFKKHTNMTPHEFRKFRF
jgi:AraC family transcriptional regulator